MTKKTITIDKYINNLNEKTNLLIYDENIIPIIHNYFSQISEYEKKKNQEKKFIDEIKKNENLRKLNDTFKKIKLFVCIFCLILIISLTIILNIIKH